MKGYVTFLEKKSFILFLSKEYTTARNTIVCGLLCLLEMVFDSESTNTIENIWGGGEGTNFGCTAALIIIST